MFRHFLIAAALFTASTGALAQMRPNAEGPTPVFDQADTNGDSVLNAQELAAAKETAKSRGAAMRQSPR